MGNILLIILVFAAGLGTVIYLLSRKGTKSDEESDFLDEESSSSMLTLENLTKDIKKVLSAQMRTNLRSENMSITAYNKRLRDQERLEQSMSEAPYGDAKARKDVKNRIKNILTSKTFSYKLTERDLNNIVPFADINKLTSRQMHEILVYMYSRVHGIDGYVTMLKEFNLIRKVPGSDGRVYYKITKEMLKDTLIAVNQGKSESLKENCKLSYNDKLDIIVQLIFSEYLGFGAIDSLYHQNVEEIDCGISGIPIGGFNIAVACRGNKEIQYGYQSIWIMVSGKNLNLEYLGFTSEADFERVSSNIYKYNATKVLSQTEGAIVSATPDGSRIAVTRPPAGESWAFWLRKFAPSQTAPMLVNNIQSKYKWIPINIIRWCVGAEQCMIVTGQTGTGKSTILKSIMRYISTEYNLRILEKTLELSIRYMYPDLNCFTFQQTGTMTTSIEADFLKKCNVAVTIVGEVAEPEQAVEYIKTGQVNSLFAFGTHHASTTEGLVESFAGNFTELGMYKDKNDAVAAVANVINIDCHLAFNGGYRHIDYINEVIPYNDVTFPSELEENKALSLQDKFYADGIKFFHDTICPKKFTVRNMCRWSNVGDVGDDELLGHFELSDEFYKEGPSDRMLKKVKQRLPEAQQKEFHRDMKMMRKAWSEVLEWNKTHTDHSEPEYSEEVAKWIEHVYSV